MTPEQFAYWLQGFAELNGPTVPTFNQWKSIQEHLATVFEKKTPPVSQIFGPATVAPEVAKDLSELAKKYVRPAPEKTLADLIAEAKQLGNNETTGSPFPPKQPTVIC